MLVVSADGQLFHAHVRDLPSFLDARRCAGAQRHQGHPRQTARRSHGARRDGNSAKDRSHAAQASRARSLPRLRQTGPQTGAGRPAGSWPKHRRHGRQTRRRRRGRIALWLARRGTRREARPPKARFRCRPISPGNARQTMRDAADYQTIFAKDAASVAAPTAGLHFTPELFTALAGARRHARDRHAPCRAGTFLPVSAERHRRPQDAQRVGELCRPIPRRASMTCMLPADAIAAVGTTSLAHAGKRGRCAGNSSCLQRRDRYLHHARLSVSRSRYPADQFPSAALDIVHAGERVLRASRS